jgi:hypothetical protein
VIDLYDHDRIALRKLAEELRNDVGRNRDLEQWVQMVKHRGENLGFVLDVQMFEDQDHPGEFWPKIEIVGRTRLEPHGFDFERQQYEVRNDIAGIEPDKVGIKPPKFEPDMVHLDDPAKFLAKTLDIPVSSMNHGHSHGDGEHTHTHDDGTTHSH